MGTVWLNCVLGVLVIFATPALAEEALWSKAKAKMTGDTGYSMNYDYEGDEGAYKFHYVVWGDGQKILTEVLEGSARGSGSRILYDPSVDKENVAVKTSMLTLRRSLGSKDIQGSSLYQPLFRQLVEGLAEPKPRETVKAGDHTILIFGDKSQAHDRIEVDAAGNPFSFRHLEKGREMKKMTFRNLKWGKAEIRWP